MSKREPGLLVQDMLDAIGKIEHYTGTYDINEFINDERTIDAVVRNLEILGEAASRLPDEYKKTHSAIEWNKIVGLRNRIVHAYFGIDLQIIWSIIKTDMNQLKRQLTSINV